MRAGASPSRRGNLLRASPAPPHAALNASPPKPTNVAALAAAAQRGDAKFDQLVQAAATLATAAKSMARATPTPAAAAPYEALANAALSLAATGSTSPSLASKRIQPHANAGHSGQAPAAAAAAASTSVAAAIGQSSSLPAPAHHAVAVPASGQGLSLGGMPSISGSNPHGNVLRPGTGSSVTAGRPKFPALDPTIFLRQSELPPPGTAAGGGRGATPNRPGTGANPITHVMDEAAGLR